MRLSIFNRVDGPFAVGGASILVVSTYRGIWSHLRFGKLDKFEEQFVIKSGEGHRGEFTGKLTFAFELLDRDNKEAVYPMDIKPNQTPGDITVDLWPSDNALRATYRW